jgi:hypothetical protein
MSDRAGGKFTIRVEGFMPRRSNTLYGFVAVAIPELHLTITDLTVHEKNGRRWVGLPAHPVIDRDGTARRDDCGARVIAALLEFAPSAFDKAGGSP